MTKDDIIRVACEAGFSFDAKFSLYIDDHDGGCDTELERFAHLVAAHEREKAAVVLQQALEALDGGHIDRAYGYIQEALAQEQWTPEDMAYRPGGLAQPEEQQRRDKRQPLIEKEIEAVYEDVSGQSLRPQDYRIVLQFARAIEAKLKEKNA